MAVAMATRARRVDVTEPVPADFGEPSYADAYEVSVESAEQLSPEQWMRRALEGAPALLRGVIVGAHRYVLLLRLGPLNDPNLVLGWRIVESTPEVTRLAASSPLAEATIVGRRLDDRGARLTTFLAFRKPSIARPLWTAVGPVHRRVAPYLMNRVARGR